MALTVKNLPAMQETWVLYLGREDPLGEGMATHASVLAWEISWTEESGGLQSRGSLSWTRLLRLSMHAHSLLQLPYQVQVYGRESGIGPPSRLLSH